MIWYQIYIKICVEIQIKILEALNNRLGKVKKKICYRRGKEHPRKRWLESSTLVDLYPSFI